MLRRHGLLGVQILRLAWSEKETVEAKRETAGAELLRRRDRPMQPDPAKGVAYNVEVMIDIAAKGEACAARMSTLVDWFD